MVPNPVTFADLRLSIALPKLAVVRFLPADLASVEKRLMYSHAVWADTRYCGCPWGTFSTILSPVAFSMIPKHFFSAGSLKMNPESAAMAVFINAGSVAGFDAVDARLRALVATRRGTGAAPCSAVTDGAFAGARFLGVVCPPRIGVSWDWTKHSGASALKKLIATNTFSSSLSFTHASCAGTSPMGLILANTGTI